MAKVRIRQGVAGRIYVQLPFQFGGDWYRAGGDALPNDDTKESRDLSMREALHKAFAAAEAKRTRASEPEVTL